MAQKEYKIITSLTNDAPYGNIKYASISFLSSQRLKQGEHLRVYGIKGYNGYVDISSAEEDIKERKLKNNNHDIFLAEIGKIYAWDDVSKSANIVYDDEKLNELDKKRRENIDKMKLMQEQLKNENVPQKPQTRKEAIMNRIKTRLYEQGKLTAQDYNKIEEVETYIKPKQIVDTIKHQEDLDECYKTDYLDEEKPCGLKYICITIYTPQTIKGLDRFYFKVRGIFENEERMEKRIRYLEKHYPDDRIHKFNVGFWCGFSEENLDDLTILKELNFGMKIFLDSMKKQDQEFNARKEEMKKQNENESKLKKGKLKREAMNETQSKPIKQDLVYFREEDKTPINELFGIINDPEISGRHVIENTSEPVVVDVK